MILELLGEDIPHHGFLIKFSMSNYQVQEPLGHCNRDGSCNTSIVKPSTVKPHKELQISTGDSLFSCE